MATETVLGTLTDRDVVTESGESIALTDEFSEAVDRTTSELADSNGAGTGVSDSTEPEAKYVSETLSSDPNLLSIFVELREHLPEASTDFLLQVLPLVVRLRHPPEYPGEGPDHFIGLRGDHLMSLLPVYQFSLVYVWKFECEQCDEMKSNLDAVFDDISVDLPAFSVYGPEWSRELYDEYECVGAPTTLFMAGDCVDARLLGGYSQSPIKTEIRKLINVASDAQLTDI